MNFRRRRIFSFSVPSIRFFESPWRNSRWQFDYPLSVSLSLSAKQILYTFVHMMIVRNRQMDVRGSLSPKLRPPPTKLAVVEFRVGTFSSATNDILEWALSPPRASNFSIPCIPNTAALYLSQYLDSNNTRLRKIIIFFLDSAFSLMLKETERDWLNAVCCCTVHCSCPSVHVIDLRLKLQSSIDRMEEISGEVVRFSVVARKDECCVYNVGWVCVCGAEYTFYYYIYVCTAVFLLCGRLFCFYGDEEWWRQLDLKGEAASRWKMRQK